MAMLNNQRVYKKKINQTMDDLGLSQQDQQVIRPKGQLLEPRLHPGFEHLPVLENSANLYWLVVSTPLKNMKVGWDDDIPNI